MLRIEKTEALTKTMLLRMFGWKPRIGTLILPSSFESYDAIEYEGKLWLVPHWIDNLTRKETRPFRIIRFDNLAHQSTKGAHWGDFALTRPLPPALFEMRPLEQQIAGIEYLEAPDIPFALPRSLDRS
jgi:hypothetical protein